MQTYKFLPNESNGRLRDNLIVPNIPMIVRFLLAFDPMWMNFIFSQSALRTMRHGSELIRRTIGAVFDVLDQEKFITQTVRKVLFGYANPLIKLGNDMLPKGTIKWPSSLFGILVGVRSG